MHEIVHNISVYSAFGQVPLKLDKDQHFKVVNIAYNGPSIFTGMHTCMQAYFVCLTTAI